MFGLSRTAAILSLSLVFTAAFADKAYLNLSAFPTISVADGKSTVTVSADIRDGSGRAVPDGTRVLFTTTLGTFRQSMVQTTSGVARAVLVAGGSPGIAKITVTGVGVDVTPATLDFEFVGDRSELSSALEYIEIVAPSYMQYTADTRIIGAAAPDKGVSVRYRDIEIEADDIQLNVNTQELRARRASVKMGRWTKEFDRLFLRLNQHKGVGLSTYRGTRFDAIVPTGRWFTAVRTNIDGTVSTPQEEDRYGTLDISRSGTTPSKTPIGSNFFNFEDLSYSPSTISARKVVVFPRKEIQFQRAEIFVAGNRVMKLPLYQVRLNQSTGPLVTDDFVSVNDNQLALNYPHYLTLEPGQTSILRLQMGGNADRGSGGNRGLFLNYEMNWNRGDQMQGSFNLNGIARNDWLASFRQYLQLGDNTNLNAQIDVPGGRSIFGNASLFRQFNGFQASLNANTNHSLRGEKFSRETYSFILEKDPTKVGRLPVQLFFGITAEDSRFTDRYASEHQSTVGLRLRGQSQPIAIDPYTSLSTGFSVSKLYGSTLSDGVAITASTMVSRYFGNNAGLAASYDYTRDGFNDAFTGQHQLSFQGFYGSGRTDFSFLASRSLDVDRIAFFGDASYRISDLWRLAGGYTMDRYFGSTFMDYNLMIGYRIGWREVGLTWSRRTNRIGVQLLGASF